MRQQGREKPKSSATSGGFEDDGSWNPKGRRGDLYFFVVSLVKERRRYPITPAEVRERILASEYRKAFSEVCLEQWQHLTTHDDWPYANCSKPTDQMVKNAGYGAFGVWDGGWFKPGGDRPAEAISGALTLLRGEVVDAILRDNLTPNQTADLLEGHGLGEACATEIARYRRMGDSWRWA